MSDTESEVEECPQCFRSGYFQKNEVCDECANISEYYGICQYCDKPNYTCDGDICAKCIEIANSLKSA